MIHLTKSSYNCPTGQLNNLPSLTIPDQTMSVREIMQRFANGQPINGNGSTPQYYGEDLEIPDIKHMDLSDAEDYLKNSARKAKELERKYNKEQSDLKASIDKQTQDKMNSLIAEIERLKTTPKEA
ncbi:MAG: hypothetical protein [Microvirus sp.]|nr:MAG: hypothetical protein [Microvirus sp.]